MEGSVAGGTTEVVVELVVVILKIRHVNKNRMSVIFRRYKPVVQEVGESHHNVAFPLLQKPCLSSQTQLNARAYYRIVLFPVKVLLKEVHRILKRRVVLDEVCYFSSS